MVDCIKRRQYLLGYVIKGSSPHRQRSPEDHESALMWRCETHHDVGALQGTLQTEAGYCLRGVEDIRGWRGIASWDRGRNQRWGKEGINVFSEEAGV